MASCVVTDKAKSKWIRFLRQEAKNLQPNEKIYLSGCGSIKNGEVDDQFYEQYPQLVDYREKIELLPEDPEETTSPKNTQVLTNAPKTFPEKNTKKFSFAHIFTRKYLVIQM